MGRRRNAVVAVHGCGRVGASVANILVSAGVGCVVPVDGGAVRAGEAAPAGYSAAAGSGGQGAGADLPGPRGSVGPLPGRTRQDAVRDLLRATSPSVRTTLPANRQHPDIAVLAPAGDARPGLAESLQAACVPHLIAEIHETTAVLGPFVQPGRTPCLTCRDLHRTAADPGWPRPLAPFGGVDAAPGRDADRPCDVVLATQLAVLAAMHVLAFLEGDPPPTAGAAIEITLPAGAQNRRELAAHPDCDCGAADPCGVFGERSPARRI